MDITASVYSLELMIVDKMLVEQVILYKPTCEDDILCTRASPSLMPLLSRGFDIPLSSLNKLNSSDGSFKLSGYILRIPYPGICLGMQIAVIEYARSILELQDANSTELDTNTHDPCLNPDMVQQFEDADLSFTGKDEMVTAWRTASVCTLELMIADKMLVQQLYSVVIDLLVCTYNLGSPMRVLHSLKESLLRISLVHPSVSFKIVDIERVDGDLHKWIDTGNRGKTDELIRKKKSRRSHTTLPFYQGKKKFFGTKTRAVRRLHHSAETIWSELPWQSSHQCDQSSTPSCGDANYKIKGSAQVYAMGSQNKSPRPHSPFQILSCYVWMDDNDAGRSTEDVSFRESLELDDSSNVMHEKRKRFMQSCSLHKSLVHDGPSFDNGEIFMLVLKRIWAVLDPWDVYSSGASEFYYDGDDLLHLLHFAKARRSSLPRVSLQAKQQEITILRQEVYDVPLMPETRTVRRLHHSAEAICSELPQQSSHQCDQSSTPSCGDSVFSNSGTGTESLKNQDTIDKTCLEGSKVPQQVDKNFILIVDGTTLAIIDPESFGWTH
ncbi:hypothetical protein KY289_015748 [Solanum tuberosum]|nr:hypothetical protein KY289_015748 [Solanum tuberosum]